MLSYYKMLLAFLVSSVTGGLTGEGGKGQEDKEKWAKGAKMKDGSGEEEDWGHGGEESF